MVLQPRPRSQPDWRPSASAVNTICAPRRTTHIARRTRCSMLVKRAPALQRATFLYLLRNRRRCDTSRYECIRLTSCMHFASISIPRDHYQRVCGVNNINSSCWVKSIRGNWTSARRVRAMHFWEYFFATIFFCRCDLKIDCAISYCWCLLPGGWGNLGFRHYLIWA
jgi:hypothetical protein